MAPRAVGSDRGMEPRFQSLAMSNYPIAIGQRDLFEYAHSYALFDYFSPQMPTYLKTVVWKGIVSSLKFDIVHELVEALEGTVIFRRDRSASRTVTCSFTPKISFGSETPKAAAEMLIQRSKSINIYFYSTEAHLTKAYIVKTLVPRLNKIIEPYTTQPEDSNIVNISFCMSSMDGANIMSRQITVPTWKEIRDNYPYNHEEINSLFKLDDPDRQGKFIFWHGPPGTGKSYLIRSALQRWKMNVRCIYIVDPENFFNNANYMQEVLLQRPTDADDDDDYTLYDDEDYSESPESSKFRLMIIEDGLNNMLTETRHDREGAISRFLNLTDGILGQGLRLVFLVTSNEKVNKIDPAFLRTGRCLQELEFPEFDKTEAIEWLQKKDKNAKLPMECSAATYSLADLYSYLTDDISKLSKTVEEKSVGFL